MQREKADTEELYNTNARQEHSGLTEIEVVHQYLKSDKCSTWKRTKKMMTDIRVGLVKNLFV